LVPVVTDTFQLAHNLLNGVPQLPQLEVLIYLWSWLHPE
jgi:hypothetical protein